MKILPQQEYHIRQVIRDNLALDPLISIRNLKKAVEYNMHSGRLGQVRCGCSARYAGEVIVRADRQKLTERLTEVKERFRVLRMELYRIVYWEMRYFPEFGIQRPTNQERMNAVKTLAQMDLALLKTELMSASSEKSKTTLRPCSMIRHFRPSYTSRSSECSGNGSSRNQNGVKQKKLRR